MAQKTKFTILLPGVGLWLKYETLLGEKSLATYQGEVVRQGLANIISWPRQRELLLAAAIYFLTNHATMPHFCLRPSAKDQGIT